MATGISLDDYPAFLREYTDFVSKLAKANYPKWANIEEIESNFYAIWLQYKTEAEHYLSEIQDCSKEKIDEIEMVYKSKSDLMVKEIKWTKIVDDAELQKIKSENDFDHKSTELNKILEERDSQVHKVVNSGIPIPLYDPEVNLLIREIYQQKLETEKKIKKQSLETTSSIINGFRKRRLKRLLYRSLLERFWAFLVVAILIEEILKEEIKLEIGKYLEPLLSYSTLIRYGCLFFALLIAWETKRRFLDPKIEKYFMKKRKEDLERDIIDSARTQTTFDCAKFYISKLRAWVKASAMEDSTAT